MYSSNKNNFFHGIMFHHFHDNGLHKKGQGSISKDEFYKIIKFIGRENILNAEDFQNRYKENKLKNTDVCLTFDDGIRCQFDIALPVLEDLNIKGFFFVYSSLFEGNPDLLEVYRYFRMNFFNKINDFYKSFFQSLDKDLDTFFDNQKENIKQTKKKFPIYSIEDIKFRLVRDKLLNQNQYKDIMLKMFKEKKFDYKKYYKILFLDKFQTKKMQELGHVIGLHSHSHPTLMEKLSYNNQLNEYQKNINILSEILNINKNQIKCMSHPCGSYNEDTIKILSDLGMELGFKQIMSIEPEKGMKKINNSYLEIARQDHSQIMKII